MKSYHYLIAALLMLPVLFSCGGKNNITPDPTPDPTPVTPVTPVTPDPVDPDPVTPAPKIEFRKTFRFDNNIISADGDGDYVAVYNKDLVTKAGDSREILVGTYTFENDIKTWTFTGLGKLELLEENQIAFTPENGSRKVYKAEISEIVTDESSNAYLMNGRWSVKETILEFRGANYSYDGLDLNKVEKDARDLGVEFKFHMEDNMVVKKVIVTDSMLAAEFNNGKAYAAEHNLRTGKDFNLNEFTNGLEGTASVQFVDELCVITINTKLDESDAKIRLTLEKLS